MTVVKRQSERFLSVQLTMFSVRIAFERIVIQEKRQIFTLTFGQQQIGGLCFTQFLCNIVA